MASSKRLKLDLKSFQKSWTVDFGFASRGERAVCALCCKNIVSQTSSIKRHFNPILLKLFRAVDSSMAGLQKPTTLTIYKSKTT